MYLIGNTNTKRCHVSTCRAVPQIASKHFVEGVDSEDFPVICRICFAGGGKDEAEYLNNQYRPDASQTNLDRYRHTVKIMTKNQLKKHLKKMRGLK